MIYHVKYSLQCMESLQLQFFFFVYLFSRTPFVCHRIFQKMVAEEKNHSMRQILIKFLQEKKNILKRFQKDEQNFKHRVNIYSSNCDCVNVFNIIIIISATYCSFCLCIIKRNSKQKKKYSITKKKVEEKKCQRKKINFFNHLHL